PGLSRSRHTSRARKRALALKIAKTYGATSARNARILIGQTMRWLRTGLSRVGIAGRLRFAALTYLGTLGLFALAAAMISTRIVPPTAIDTVPAVSSPIAALEPDEGWLPKGVEPPPAPLAQTAPREPALPLPVPNLPPKVFPAPEVVVVAPPPALAPIV